ncbi:MAG: polymer-forming cytoskeletal protein [Myxococcales bacterium]
MFGKRQQPASSITVIAAGSVVEGTLRVKGMLQLDGTIQGTLVAEGHVSVGPEGKILGDVIADNLSIAGRIEGTVNARGHLHVLASGVVQGGARYASLEVDRGGVMDGRASRLDDKAGSGAPANDVEARPQDVEMISDAAAAE